MSYLDFRIPVQSAKVMKLKSVKSCSSLHNSKPLRRNCRRNLGNNDCLFQEFHCECNLMRAYSISFAPFPISHDHFFISPHQSRIPTINDIIFCSLHDHQSPILTKTQLTYENYLAQSAAKIETLNFSNNFLAIYTHS